jgi:hypothetical protein
MKPLPNETEAQYLQRQAEDAKAALSQAAQDLTRVLSQGLDPRGLTKDHPWATMAGAAVAGFAAAALLVPTKEDQALKRLAAIERALSPQGQKPHQGGTHHEDGEDGGAKQFAKGQSGFLGGLGRQVLEAVKPAIMSALTAGITAKAAQPDQPQQGPPPPQYAGGDIPNVDPSQAGAHTRTPDPVATDPSASV